MGDTSVFSFRPFEPADRAVIATLVLRQSDQLELVAASGLSPTDALLKSVEKSAKTWVLLCDGHIEGVCGVTEYHRIWHKTPYGVPWLLATDNIAKCWISLAKEAKRLVNNLADDYDLLLNYVDSRNTTSRKWLKWLGFTVDEKHPRYFRDPTVPFYYFSFASTNAKLP